MQRCTLAAILVLLGLGSTLRAADAGPDPYARVRGMTISCHGSGQSWGSDDMVATMAELKGMGVNWITIHPYGGIRADGTVTDPGTSRMYGDPTWLRRPIEEAHRLGLKIMIKPHIAYWGSGFSWRGEIEFDTAEEWARFFETYRRWILHVAELAHDADAFVVGTELERTTHRAREWRSLIAEIRDRTDAPLTYAANWDSYMKVPFWDVLDVVGIQGYFPLVQHDRVPTEGEIRAGWSQVLERLHDIGRTYGKPVLLAELGYNESALAARQPWAYARGGEQATVVQERCLRAALESIENDEVVVGAFLWKWFPGASHRGNFLKSTPTMRAVIREAWQADRVADESPLTE